MRKIKNILFSTKIPSIVVFILLNIIIFSEGLLTDPSSSIIVRILTYILCNFIYIAPVQIVSSVIYSIYKWIIKRSKTLERTSVLEKPQAISEMIVKDTAENIELSKPNENINNTKVENTSETFISEDKSQTPYKLTGEYDEYFVEAGRLILENNKASIGLIQRHFKLGFNRASNIMNQLEYAGVVDKENEFKPRKILMNIEDFNLLISTSEFLAKPNPIQQNETSFHPASEPMLKRVHLYNDNYDYMEGHEFEYFCADLLKCIGYTDAEVTPGSGDQGVDILACKDGVKYAIQCKCYSSDIGNKAVQEVYSGAKYYNCHVPVVLTNRYFTKSAKELAQKTNVLLWDRDILEQMIFQKNCVSKYDRE